MSEGRAGLTREGSLTMSLEKVGLEYLKLW